MLKKHKSGETYGHMYYKPTISSLRKEWRLKLNATGKLICHCGECFLLLGGKLLQISVLCSLLRIGHHIYYSKTES